MAVKISLHPLVLMNISDHYTRLFAESSVKSRIFGVLVGSIMDRNIHIQNSFECPGIETESSYQLDLEFIEKRLAMVMEIFPQYEFLGWYSSGAFSPSDMNIQKSLINFSEHLLYLNFNDTLTLPEEVLPVEIYETHVTVSENSTNHEFRKVIYSIETTDAERISVDFVSRTGAGTGESSMYSNSLSNFISAMRLFKKRLNLLLYLVQNNPKLQKDRKIMRKIHEISNRIPVLPAYDIENQFKKEISEELLVILMSTMTKGSYHLSELVDKFQILNNNRLGE
jgi:COP9 signalosome complex subunit 6